VDLQEAHASDAGRFQTAGDDGRGVDEIPAILEASKVTFSVLVLDDEPWELSWIEDLATACGGVCYFADSFETAKGLFDQHKPELVTVDIRIGAAIDPAAGATIENADPDWLGLRFLRFVRVERADARTKLLVYTGLDRERLQRIVEDAFQGRFFTKYEAREFAQVLRDEFRNFASRK
jgi:CheY-like chemotaxis protein